MIDDWVLIRDAGERVPEYLRFWDGIPERVRYRPGFLTWGALQWHTLWAPEGTSGPQFWDFCEPLSSWSG